MGPAKVGFGESHEHPAGTHRGWEPPDELLRRLNLTPPSSPLCP